MESLYSFADLRKDAQALLALINTLPQKEWEKRPVSYTHLTLPTKA